MLRLRFHASWLPEEHNPFWTAVDCTTTGKTITDLIDYFNDQQKSFAELYEFHIPKRATKAKYLKAFVADCVLPPHAQANEILRENDEIDFRLAIDAQDHWLQVQPAPAPKRKRSVEREIPAPPPPPPKNELDDVLRSIAQPAAQSSTKETFAFQFGNKRGRPIPPRPQVISAAKVNSLVPRQVLRQKR